MVFDTQVFNAMGVHSSSTSLNNIRCFAPSVAPPDLLCRTCTTRHLHPFLQDPGFFPPIYKTIPFAIFQKACIYLVSILDSVNTQSSPQHSSLPYPLSLCHGVSSHHILDWRLHTSPPPPPPPIHVTLKPTTSMTKVQNGIILHQITRVPFVWYDVHYLLSPPESLLPPTSPLRFSSEVFASSFIASPEFLGLEIPSNLPYPLILSYLSLSLSAFSVSESTLYRSYLYVFYILLRVLACASTIYFKYGTSTRGALCSNRYKVMCGATSGCWKNSVSKKSFIT